MGLIIGAANIITNNIITNKYPGLLQWILDYLYLFIGLNALGLSFALFSFLPRTRRFFDSYYESNGLGKCDNVLYYSYIRSGEPIRSSKPETYLAKLRDSLPKKVEEDSNLESNYAIQILINSRIAFIKYRYFKIALIFTIIAILILLGSFLLRALLPSLTEDEIVIIIAILVILSSFIYNCLPGFREHW